MLFYCRDRGKFLGPFSEDYTPSYLTGVRALKASLSFPAAVAAVWPNPSHDGRLHDVQRHSADGAALTGWASLEEPLAVPGPGLHCSYQCIQRFQAALTIGVKCYWVTPISIHSLEIKT